MNQKDMTNEELIDTIFDGGTCTVCEGSGQLWADGGCHLPTYKGAMIDCPKCGGSGLIVNNDEDAKAELLLRLDEADALRKENEELRAQAQKGGRP